MKMLTIPLIINIILLPYFIPYIIDQTEITPIVGFANVKKYDYNIISLRFECAI